MHYIDRVLEDLVKKNPGEKEFHQAATEALKSVKPIVDSNKIYEELNQALNYLLKKLPIAMLFIPIDVLIRSFHFSNIWL